MEMQKATKKFFFLRNQKQLYSEGRKNGTRKEMCFFSKKKQTEKGKRKREMKNRSLPKKKQRRRQTRGEKQEEKKGEGRREV